MTTSEKHITLTIPHDATRITVSIALAKPKHSGKKSSSDARDVRAARETRETRETRPARDAYRKLDLELASDVDEEEDGILDDFQGPTDAAGHSPRSRKGSRHHEIRSPLQSPLLARAGARVQTPRRGRSRSDTPPHMWDNMFQPVQEGFNGRPLTPPVSPSDSRA
jgi:hypothetical protein